MNLSGYTNIPESLPESQQMIVRLLNEQKKYRQYSEEKSRALHEAVTMIEDARKALNTSYPNKF